MDEDMIRMLLGLQDGEDIQTMWDGIFFVDLRICRYLFFLSSEALRLHMVVSSVIG